MPLLVVAALVAIVHLATGIAAWGEVGLLADDREMIGAAILRHRGDWTLAGAFFPEPVAESTRALYRPFIDLLFWLEYPRFGIDATGYHVVNSVMHCGTSLLWFALVRRWSGSVAAGLATAVLFVGWPGHSEVTHWIAARTNVQSVLFLSVALLLHDLGCARAGRSGQLLLLVLASLFACVAVGSKESAIFIVPLAGIVSWFRSDSMRSATVRALPMVLLVFGWLWWRASCLGTWGSGTHYGWMASRVGGDSCTDWLALLVAPVHRDHSSSAWVLVLVVLHIALLAVALRGWHNLASRRVLAVGGALLAMGYMAGIGLEKLQVESLENVRYSYEPVLGLCAMLGVAVATLPSRARGVTLALVVLAHAWVLDNNRQSWLRAGAVYQRMQSEVVERARATGQPVRVFDAPGVYEGAFAYLNSYTEFLFWQQTAPPGANLRGSVTSTVKWRDTLRELATAAAARQPLDALAVRWSDGGLDPLQLDQQWPQKVSAGAEIRYARVARHRPIVGTSVPVHVLLRTDTKVELAIEGTTGRPVVVEAGNDEQAVRLECQLPRDPDGDVYTVTLRVRAGEAEKRYELLPVSPVAR